MTSGGDAPTDTRPAAAPGELVERLRHCAVGLLADLAVPPRRLRVQAGEVAVEIEWAGTHVDAAPAPLAPAGPPTAAPGPAAVPAAPTDDPPGVWYVTAPTVGTFYRAPEAGAAPFVAEGDAVVAGQQVAIVEAMKLMIAVEAEASGRVVEVLKGDGEPVEYGERLMALAGEAA